MSNPAGPGILPAWLKNILLFALLGPPVGALLFLGPRALWLVANNPMRDFPVLAIVAVALPFSYLPGLAPALATAALTTSIWRRVPGPAIFPLALASLAGFCCSATCAGFFASLVDDPGDGIYRPIVPFALAGAGATAICCGLSWRLGWLTRPAIAAKALSGEDDSRSRGETATKN